MFLRTRLHQHMLTGANRNIAFEEVLDALMHAMKGVLQKNAWSVSFVSSGFGEPFEVRSHLLQLLELARPPMATAELPTFTQFQECFPKGRYIPFMDLLAPLLPQKERSCKRPRVAEAAFSESDAEDRSWAKRLRPRRKGRLLTARAKPKATPTPSALPHIHTPSIPASSHMTTVRGHALPSLRPLRIPIRRSR